jgi:hypothetical protein
MTWGSKPDGLSDRGTMRGTNPFFAPGETMYSPDSLIHKEQKKDTFYKNYKYTLDLDDNSKNHIKQ